MGIFKLSSTVEVIAITILPLGVNDNPKQVFHPFQLNWDSLDKLLESEKVDRDFASLAYCTIEMTYPNMGGDMFDDICKNYDVGYAIVDDDLMPIALAPQWLKSAPDDWKETPYYKLAYNSEWLLRL